MQAAATQLEKTPNLDRAIRKLMAEAKLYRRRGRREDARFLESILETIEAAREEDRNRVLNIAETAQEGGYSERQVRRMVGKTVPNAQPYGPPGVRYKDVPRKKVRKGAARPRRTTNGSNSSVDAAGAVTMVVLGDEE